MRPLPATPASSEHPDRDATRELGGLEPRSPALAESQPVTIYGTAAPGATACPYPGLRGFDESSQEWFFGRERMVDDLLNRLRRRATERAPLVLVGASGSGKSSLLRAGLLPALGRGGVKGSQHWPRLVMTPGEHPIDTLVERLTQVAGLPAMGRLVRESLRAEPERLPEIVVELLSAPGSTAPTPPARSLPALPTPRMIIAVDQFEEVFTLCADPAEREAFVRALCAAAGASPVVRAGPGGWARPGTEPVAAVVIGLRADFYGQAAAHAELVEVLQTGQLLVGAMTALEIRDAVVNPARAAGGDVEPGLVELVLRDLGTSGEGAGSGFAADPGSLPLLAHALRASWLARTTETLTVADYLRIGGLTGAIAQTAEAAYRGMDAAAQQATRPLLMRMVRLGENGADARRRTSRALLLAQVPEPGAGTALDALIAARLVEADTDAGGDSLQIAHEALLRSWPRLREWMDLDRASAIAIEQLQDAAEVWERGERDRSYLFSGSRLAAAREWVDEQPGEAPLSPAAREFYDESTRVERAEQKASARRSRRLRQLAASLAVLLLVAAASAGLAYDRSVTASEARDRALSQRIAAQAENARRDNPAIAAQLSLLALRTADTAEARGAVLSSFNGGSGVPTRYPAHDKPVGTVKFSPDGSLIAAGSDDWTASLWDADDPHRHTPLAVTPDEDNGGHGRAVKAVAFSRDSTVLATGGADGVTKLWDVSDPENLTLLATLPEGTSEVYGLAFNPAADLLAVGGYGTSAHIYDVSDPSEPELLGALSLHRRPVVALAFSPDGQFLAAGDEGSSALMWHVADPAEPRPLYLLLDREGPAHAPGTIRAICFTADGGTVYTAGWGGIVRKFTGPDLFSLEHTATAGSVDAVLTTAAAHPTNGLVAYAGFNHYGALVADPDASEASLTFLKEGAVVWTVDFSPDGRQLATGSIDGGLRVWEIPGPSLFGRHGDQDEATVNPVDGTVATTTATAVELWDVDDPYAPVRLGEITDARADELDPLGDAHFSPDGRTLAVATGAHVVFYDVTRPAAPARITEIDAPAGGAHHVVFSPDGRTLAVGDLGADPDSPFQAVIETWDVSDIGGPRRLDSVVAHRSAVREMAFTPDSQVLASVADRSAKLWDLSDPADITPLAELPEFPGGAWGVSFSPDGEMLAVGGGEPSATLWDVTDPRAPVQLADLPGHVTVVNTVAFSPDGGQLITGSHDNTVRVWDLADPRAPELVQRLSRSAGLASGISKLLYLADGETVLGTVRTVPGVIWDMDVDRVAERICERAGVGITEQEWRRFVPDLPYDPVCD